MAEKNPSPKRQRLVTVSFSLLYAVGAYLNFRRGNFIMAWFWIGVLTINVGLLLYGFWKKSADKKGSN